MIKKYKWKCRILVIKTPDYKSLKYKRAKKLYQKDIKKFHKRMIKLISKKVDNNFSIELFGFDGIKKDHLKVLIVKKYLKLSIKCQCLKF